MRPLHLLLASMLVWPVAAPAHAESAPTSGLTLAECLAKAMANSPEARSQRLDAAIGKLDYAQAGHRYGLSLRAGPTVERAIRPTTNSFVAGGTRLEEWSQDYQVSLKQDLLTGGDVGLRFNSNVFDTNSTRVDFNPAFSPGLSFVLNQPLLRDWWQGGRDVEVARLEAEAAQVRLDERLMRLVADTERAYWDLSAAREEIRVRERSVKLVKDLLVINREKAKAGLMARLDVLQAEASLAVREGALLEAQRGLAAAEDRLRRLIDPEAPPEAWATPLVPADRPAFASREVAFDGAWAIAKSRRPDLMQANLNSLKQSQMLDSAGNRLWPRLDVTGSAGVSNVDRAIDRAVGDLSRMENYRLQAGVQLEWPLGPNADRDEYDKARLRHEQVGIDRQATEQRAFVEVREAVRDVGINAKRVESAALAKRLAEAKLDAEQEKLKAGLSTNFQVLEFQKDLEEASLSEVKSTIEYLQSLTRLEQAQGTLLESRKLLTPPAVTYPWR